MSDAPAKLVELDWEHSPDFLACFEEEPTPRIRIERAADDLPPKGSLCTLMLRFKDRGTEFQMHGVLTAHEDGHAIFELLPEQQMRLELVLVGARGESLPYRRRRHTRVPCHLVARVLGKNGKTVTAAVTSFGAGGLYLVLDKPVAPEERIQMEIALGDGKRLELAGRVTNCNLEGPDRGSSVEFLFASAAQRDEVATIAADIAADIAATSQ